MSDSPIPPASVSPPPLSPEPPRRAGTILGRLAAAVREQNWFAVVLEVVIVIVGVVIGFQVTGWGQGRADQAKERAYLQQLAEDLRETERQILWADARTRPFDTATSKLVRAFFAPEPPPADSVLRWRMVSGFYSPLIPTLGTAEALIASGDLALIQNDSLRSEITAYVPFVKNRQANSDEATALWWAASVAIANRYDPGDMILRMAAPAAIDSMAAANPYTVLPAGERQRPFPVDVGAMLQDQEAYNQFRIMLEHKTGMMRNRGFVWRMTGALLEQVEAELERRWGIPPVRRPASGDGRAADRLFEVEALPELDW